MRSIFQIRSELHECLIGIRVDGAGSVWDPFPGVHHLLEHLVSAKVEEAITRLGGRYDAFMYREYQTHTLAVPCDRVAEALAVVSNGMRAVCDGMWVQEELARSVRALHRERQIHQRNPHEQLMEVLDEAILCPVYARPTSIIELPDLLQVPSLVGIARKAFDVERMVMVCLAPDEYILHLVERSIDLPKTETIAPLVFPECFRVAKNIQASTTKKDEAFIRFDFPGYGVDSPHGSFNRVASSFLVGQIGVLSRALGEAGGGWCYDLFSDTAQFALFGQVNFGTACAPEDLDKVQSAAMEAVSLLYDSPPINTDEWGKLGELTAHDVNMLVNNSYDLLDFLLDEVHPLFVGDPDPGMLLDPWHSKKGDAAEAFRTIFDSKTISIGKMKNERTE